MDRRNFRVIWTRLVGVWILLLVLAVGAGRVLAHGEATLTVSPAVVAPGAEITVTGEGVEAGEKFTITVEGLNFKTTLGTVTVGDGEEFHQNFVVPAAAPPSTYQVRATSAEGEVITAELTVETDAAASVTAASAKPSAELMQLERPRSARQWGIIIVGLVVSAALGLWLVQSVT
ncbi:MAG: hypothetical protein FOGNACKC_03334 [Anaerolineae bacterium]|nr:hypothetical protein [Anaerolineae bacterium]